MDLLPRWRVISLVFLLGCVISRTSGYWWTKEKISETPNLDKADLYLDTAEDIIVKIAKTIKSSGKAGQAVLATGALLYGGQFKYTSLQVQAFRLTGWAQTKEGLEVLLKSYRETRKAVRSEYPNLMKAKDELDLNSASIQEYRRILQLGKEGEMDMKEVLLSRKNLEKALVTRDAIKASMSSFDAIREALDLPALQKVVMGMQTGALSVFSVANSNTIGKMALGFSMSDILYKSLGWEKADLEELQRKIGEDSNFLRKLGNFSPKARRSSALEWSRGACAGVGFTLAAFFRDKAITLSTALWGASVLTDILVSAIDKIITFEVISAHAHDPRKRKVFVGLLTAWGLLMQTRDWRNVAPLTRTLLFLPIQLDRILQRLVLGGGRVYRMA